MINKNDQKPLTLEDLKRLQSNEDPLSTSPLSSQPDVRLGLVLAKFMRKMLILFGIVFVVGLAAYFVDEFYSRTTFDPEKEFTTSLRQMLSTQTASYSYDVEIDNYTIKFDSSFDFSRSATADVYSRVYIYQKTLLGNVENRLSLHYARISQNSYISINGIENKGDSVDGFDLDRLNPFLGLWLSLDGEAGLPALQEQLRPLLDSSLFTAATTPLGEVIIGNFDESTQAAINDFILTNNIYTIESSDDIGTHISYDIAINPQKLDELNRLVANKLGIDNTFAVQSTYEHLPLIVEKQNNLLASLEFPITDSSLGLAEANVRLGYVDLNETVYITEPTDVVTADEVGAIVQADPGVFADFLTMLVASGDSQRIVKVGKLADVIQAYDDANGYYPKTGQVNDSQWRREVLRAYGVIPDNETFYSIYSYEALPDGCTNITILCQEARVSVDLAADGLWPDDEDVDIADYTINLPR